MSSHEVRGRCLVLPGPAGWSHPGHTAAAEKTRIFVVTRITLIYCKHSCLFGQLHSLGVKQNTTPAWHVCGQSFHWRLEAGGWCWVRRRSWPVGGDSPGRQGRQGLWEDGGQRCVCEQGSWGQQKCPLSLGFGHLRQEPEPPRGVLGGGWQGLRVRRGGPSPGRGRRWGV